MYTVCNICGGTLYNGKSLDRAMEVAISHFAEPYVISKKGKRPVVNGPSGPVLGEFKQTYDDLVDHISLLD